MVVGNFDDDFSEEEPAAGNDGDSVGDDGDSVWPCLSLADLKADLAECEQAVSGPATRGTKVRATPGEEELRMALQKGLGGTSASVDPDVFFAAQKILHGIAAELQEVIVQAETLQFDNAALVASILHGPMRPPTSESENGDATPWIGLPAVEVFGPDAAPQAPKLFELSLPAKASDLAEYQQRLNELPAALFLGRPLRLCFGEVDRKQDEKDIGRDELVVNGEPVSGAKGGYAAAHAAIVSGLRASSALLSEDAADRAAQLLLSVLNRTCSGFAAFEEVLHLFDCPEAVIVSPDSAAARPLEAAILGGVVLGRAHTRYAVRRADGGEEVPMAVVDAIFTFRLTAQLLQRLTATQEDVPEGSSAWPAEEITAAVLLHRTGAPAPKA